MNVTAGDTGFVPMRLRGAKIALVPFTAEHITQRYLAWLADDEVNRYSRRLGQPAPSAAQARAWLAGLARDEIVFAIETDDFGHIGNIKYGPINWSNLAADISIMIGAVESWGHGYGAEATYLVAKHLFGERGVNRLSAASINPGFIRMVEKLGWQREGNQREEAIVAGKFYDSVLLSFLRREFVRRTEFEAESS